MNKSASLSYYTIISFFPTLILLVSVAGSFLSAPDFEKEMSTFIREVLPYQSDLIDQNLHSLFSQRRAFSWIGFITLLISAQVLFVNLEGIINEILHSEKNRHFLLKRIWFFAWLLGMLFALFAPLSLELLSKTMAKMGQPFSAIGQVSARGGFVLVGLLVFIFIMLIVPIKRLSPLRIFSGAVFFSLAMHLGKYAFKYFTLIGLDRYNLIYGSLSSIVLGVLWIFYFYNLLLFFVYWVGQEEDPLYQLEFRSIPRPRFVD